MKSDRVVELGKLSWTTSVLIRVPSCIFNWKFHWAIKDNFLLLILKFENFKDIFYFEGHFQTLNCIASNAWICLYANSSWQNTSNSARISYMQGVLPGYMLSDNMGGGGNQICLYINLTSLSVFLGVFISYKLQNGWTDRAQILWPQGRFLQMINILKTCVKSLLFL